MGRAHSGETPSDTVCNRLALDQTCNIESGLSSFTFHLWLTSSLQENPAVFLLLVKFFGTNSIRTTRRMSNIRRSQQQRTLRSASCSSVAAGQNDSELRTRIDQTSVVGRRSSFIISESSSVPIGRSLEGLTEDGARPG